jgi:hypothetical protein
VYRNDCSSCHTEQTYKPSTFTIERHGPTRFPLNGAHQAVLCRNCHSRPEKKDLVFRFESVGCVSCHRDVHGGQMKAIRGGSCETCHTTEAWKPATFDHSSTRFNLTGKHAQASCIKCHERFPVITQCPSACESCHRDKHAGQFALHGSTDCGTCHTPEAWRSVTFDHQTRSSFPLTGTHRTVQCEKCHKTELIGNESVIRFKPLPKECSSCHATRKEEH